MTTLEKLLPEGAIPAQSLIERANVLLMTGVQRQAWPETLQSEDGEISITVEEKRELENGDVFVDTTGALWVVQPQEEEVLVVTGADEMMREAVGAFINRGIRVAQADEGFAVLPDENVERVLTMLGLTVEKVTMPFDPVRFVKSSGCGGGCGGCSCGGNCGSNDSEGGSCGCGCGGHHDEEHGEGCGCGEHHHDHQEAKDGETCSCGCGGHHH